MPEHEDLLEELRLTYPWAVEMGLFEEIVRLVRDDTPESGIISEVRKTSQWQTLFPGMYDENGQRRFDDEADYLRTIEDYRTVLRQFGRFDPADDVPTNYLGFMQQGIHPDELQKRFDMYDEVERGSAELKDAYYVFAGMEVSTDDLYRALVDPSFAEQLESAYNRVIVNQTFDYETFITRATERSLDRVAESLRVMEDRGLLTGSVVQNLLNVDPNFAREVAGALFTGGELNVQRPLSLNELTQAFEYAMLGSAATEQGLTMPNKERLEQFRKAGIDRRKALQSYGMFSEQRNALRAMAERANVESLSQKVFEDAAFLADPEASKTLRKATSTEKALGQRGSGFASGQEGQRIVQRGR